MRRKGSYPQTYKNYLVQVSCDVQAYTCMCIPQQMGAYV